MTAFPPETIDAAVRQVQFLLSYGIAAGAMEIHLKAGYAIYLYDDFAYIFGRQGIVTYSIARNDGWTAMVLADDPQAQGRMEHLREIAASIFT